MGRTKAAAAPLPGRLVPLASLLLPTVGRAAPAGGGRQPVQALCADNPRYVSRLGLSCAKHTIFGDCESYSLVGLSGDEVGDLIRNCPKSCRMPECSGTFLEYDRLHGPGSESAACFDGWDPACTDDPDYALPTGGSSCSYFFAVDCTGLATRGYTEEEVFNLINHCPCSCGIECGTWTMEATPSPTPSAALSMSEQPSTAPSEELSEVPSLFPSEKSSAVPSSLPPTLHNTLEKGPPSDPSSRPSAVPSRAPPASTYSPALPSANLSNLDGGLAPISHQHISDTHNSARSGRTMSLAQLVVICACVIALFLLVGMIFVAKLRKKRQRRSDEEAEGDILEIKGGSDESMYINNSISKIDDVSADVSGITAIAGNMTPCGTNSDILHPERPALVYVQRFLEAEENIKQKTETSKDNIEQKTENYTDSWILKAFESFPGGLWNHGRGEDGAESITPSDMKMVMAWKNAKKRKFPKRATMGNAGATNCLESGAL